MSDERYAPPKASLDAPSNVYGGINHNADQQRFYVVSPRKFWVLFIATFGTYRIYWFYRNWKQYKLDTSNNLWPVARSIFPVFFTHQLFRRIDERIYEQGYAYDWPYKGLAWAFIALSIVDNVVDRLVGKAIGAPITTALSMTLVLIICSTLARAQTAINVAESDLTGDTNKDFSAANIAWIAVGVVAWLLFIIDTMGLLDE